MSPPRHSPLWLSLEPGPEQVRLMLTEPFAGPLLKAVLPPPTDPGATVALLQALSHWHGRPLHVALDADAEDVHHHPERWALLAGDLAPLDLVVQWVRRPSPAHLKHRGRFLEELGRFQSARRLVGWTATGQP